MGPLAGVRVVELAGIGPVPFAGMMLADMGADVIRVTRPGAPPSDGPEHPLHRGRPSMALDLKRDADLAIARELIERADVLVEGYRPGVMERLGLGPPTCLERNPRLVYARMTGWGQDGPLASRSGHDINYIAVAGVLGAVRRPGERPLPPLNLVGDFGGGAMYLLLGITCALLERSSSGRGQVVDAAMVDGAASLTTLIHGLIAQGRWPGPPGTNLLDGGAPFYDTYETADGRHVAVGAIEPAFYAELLRGLGIDPERMPAQHDRPRWGEVRRVLSEAFRSRTLKHWMEVFVDSDACVSPVLSMEEAAAHPHLCARSTFTERDGVRQPSPAPRLSRTPARIRSSGEVFASAAAWELARDAAARLRAPRASS